MATDSKLSIDMIKKILNQYTNIKKEIILIGGYGRFKNGKKF
jgi:hypothetical protein